MKRRVSGLLVIQPNIWLVIAAANGFLAVLAGAFAAHGLEAYAGPAALTAFKTGAQYHMYHALALAAVAWRATERPGSVGAALAGWGFFLGVILFSGSLYVLGLSGPRGLVWLTPLGGLLFLAGWAALVYDGARGICGKG